MIISEAIQNVIDAFQQSPNEQNLIDLRNLLHWRHCEIIQQRFVDEGELPLRDEDELLERDFRAMLKPRKKRAERLNEGIDNFPE